MTDFVKEGRFMGQLGKDNVFRKKIEGSKHIMRKTDSIGIDEEVFDQLPENASIRIFDTEEGTIYSISYQAAKEVGIVEDYGFGRQVFISRSAFSTNQKKP